MRELTWGHDFHKNIQYDTEVFLKFLPPAKKNDITSHISVNVDSGRNIERNKEIKS